ncbi:MAG: FKBP-type peptidyl-prolyl cis-trans isomerase [Deltaproteobacteria bacterium]|nr:FKBP-type peptidyl-prolyl cis-trans isomerase [Deltaproteobacteria bacterium]
MKTQWMVLGLVALSSVTGCKRGWRHRGGGTAVASTSSATPRTDQERAFYSLGLMLGQRTSEFNMSPTELAMVQRGLSDSINHRTPLVNMREYLPRLQEMSEQRARAASVRTREEGTRFAAAAAREPGATRTPSGLVYRETTPGTGPSPSAQDEVTVHYTGTLMDGTEFDSSRGRGEPARFRLDGVIPCWTEAVQRMHVGGRAQIVCPPDIAYGDRAQRVIPAGSTLKFDVELIAITPAAVPDADAGPTAPSVVSPGL